MCNYRAIPYFEVHFPQLELPVVFLLLQATDDVVQLAHLLLQFVCHIEQRITHCYGVVTTMIRLRFDGRSTDVRFHIESH